MAYRFLNGSVQRVLYCLRAAATSVGWTTCPVALDQWFFVKVTTAASSVSESCFHDGIAVLVTPCSTTCTWRPLSASSTTAEPSSGLIGPPPLPLAWWHCAQLAL